MNWKNILFFFFSFLTNLTFSQEYNFRHFNSTERFNQSFIYCITQDAKGYLWVGAGNGLVRYNGFVFENYTTSDSLADNFITCGISNGTCLWFGHMNGQLSYFNGVKFKPIRIPQSNGSPITHFTKSSHGQIWGSTYANGLISIDSGNVEIKHHSFDNQLFAVTFEFMNDSDILVGTNTGLLYCHLQKSGKIKIIKTIAEVPEAKVTCIQKMRRKAGFFIATENDGIYELIKNKNLFKVSKIITNQSSNLIGIQNIYEDNLSNLWVSSLGKGLMTLVISPLGKISKINYFNTSNGFGTDNVKTVYEDREGNIWSGSYGKGLILITPKSFSFASFNNPLCGNNILSIYINRQYRWIGTENGLVKTDILTGKIVKFYSKGSGLPKDAVTAIYSSNGKELWIGTEKNGVYKMTVENDHINKYFIQNGTLENAITAITGKGNQVWIGTKKGLGNINTDTNIVNWYSISQGGLPHNYINCLYVDRRNRLWISTHSNTLVYIQNKKVCKIPLNSGGGILTLGPITEDTKSQIWVGSNGNGVFMISSDSITNLTTKEGLLSNFCYSVICDNQKNIWIGHKGGLSKIRTTDFLIKPIKQIEGITDNYQLNTNAIFKDRQGKIWFGSDKGLISYNPLIENSHLHPPVLSITSIKINEEEWNITSKIVLPPGNHKIRIDFMGICLKEAELVNYQYKLEGYDDWSQITNNTSVSYNHLPEGKYTFILKASSGEGKVSEYPLTISILIQKPIWKKWWFFIIISLILFVLIDIYIKRREHRFLAEKRILEEKVHERTYEIQCQRDEIESQRNEINEKNASITSSIMYASHIQNAILPPLELIDKLFPNNFILNKPKDIVSGDFYWLAEKDGKVIFAIADCTGHGVPGAFMSLLGITLLNEIVIIEGITKSDAIVTKLRERVILSLKQNRKDITTANGMDIALCVLDRNQKKIQFTGGKRDLVYIRNKELNIVKADHVSVSALLEDSGPFTLEEIDYKEGDIFYLFSDGYPDQFGGDQDRKYLSHRFYCTLLEIQELPMKSQKEYLELKLNEWMKNTIQTDDITVMGIRL